MISLASLLGLPNSTYGHTLSYLHFLSTAFIILLKNRTYNISAGYKYVPWCLAHEGNLIFLGLLDGVWISGTAIGFWFYSFLNGSTDDGFTGPRPLMSTIFGLLEAATLLGVVAFCFLGRGRRVRA